jgi:hypothetical protein
MKKIYEAPKLSNHGTVAQMTNFFGTAGTDKFTGPNGSVVSTGTGSIDACATQPGSGTCL